MLIKDFFTKFVTSNFDEDLPTGSIILGIFKCFSAESKAVCRLTMFPRLLQFRSMAPGTNLFTSAPKAAPSRHDVERSVISMPVL